MKIRNLILVLLSMTSVAVFSGCETEDDVATSGDPYAPSADSHAPYPPSVEEKPWVCGGTYSQYRYPLIAYGATMEAAYLAALNRCRNELRSNARNCYVDACENQVNGDYVVRPLL